MLSMLITLVVMRLLHSARRGVAKIRHHVVLMFVTAFMVMVLTVSVRSRLSLCAVLQRFLLQVPLRVHVQCPPVRNSQQQQQWSDQPASETNLSDFVVAALH